MSLLDTLLNDGVVLESMTADSRKVASGSLFLAYPGEKSDGRDFIAQAIAQGAAAVIWEQKGYAWNPQWDLPNLSVNDLKAQAGYIADGFYSRPSSHLWMIGVTGTNGKTSCSHWLAQAFDAVGRKSAVVGTLGNGFPNALSTAINTTPDPIILHGMLADYLSRGAKTVAMEVSSHGLEQGRVNGVHFDVAVFTNLTRDHLDYHGDMASYASAKRKLFDWDSLSCAVLNIDDAFGRQLAQELKERGEDVLTYGLEAGAVKGHALQFSAQGMTMQVTTPYGDAEVSAPVFGRFNAYNLLAVLASLLASDVPLADAVAALAGLKPVPGRMQTYGGNKTPLVVVDYAHTPDALENVLASLKEQHPARLVCVFGCGGDRDAGKRPLMGEVAARLADFTIVTSDNPRSELAAVIIEAITAGIDDPAKYTAEADRASAIRQAIAFAQPQDIVLVAGKGHEDYQEINGVKTPFSDGQVVQQALQEYVA